MNRLHRLAGRYALAPAMALIAPLAVAGSGGKVGLSLTVDADGFVLNPLVNKIVVVGVEKASLAEGVGIVAGDEITAIEGHVVKGARANDLKPYLTFNPGETRTMQLRHATGMVYEAKITKPKD